ncbi:MAG: GNAT family N-acetyltransferase [Acidobacteria bacterium]|nr:MAG: GNAT family N-acetyltransferase [Acidobacteriota bacterium]
MNRVVTARGSETCSIRITLMNDAAKASSISFRAVTPEDEEFLLKLYKSSRGDDLRGLGWSEDRISEFLEMQYEARQRLHENDYQNATDELVLLDGKPAGHLSIERREDEIRCVDIALLPEKRRAGIGTLLIRGLQDEARGANKPLRLQVIRFNRAVTLLERLGFARTSETGTHFQMEWVP